ncbi:MAG: c-type cytochrome biogenesis protein CcmI [Alphaproteobacteria bacterium]|nr:c-type cytochrome biogenesis protein CcmI [Alphaproteobacteria bacterium]
MLWVLAGLLILITVFLIARPLLAKPSSHDGSRADYDLAVFKDQLSELEDEHAQGLIDGQALEAAKLEVQRRLLAAAHASKEETHPLGLAPRRLLALALLLVLPLAGGALYLVLGSPKQPDQPYLDRLAMRLGTDVSQAQHQLDEVARLTEHLGRHPEDGAAWRDLGRAQRMLGRHPDGAESLRQALTNGEREPEVIAEMAESQVYADQGEVSIQAKRAFETVLLVSPDHPKALYFMGQERMQDNDAKGALHFWRRLEAASPAGAGWLPMLKQRITEAETRLSGKAPQTQSGAPDIGAMVAKLEARMKENPKDVQGWTMLGRSYAVLGEMEKARDAYQKAMALTPDDLDLKQSYAVMLFEVARSADPKAKVPTEAAALMNEVLKQDPNSFDALYLAGQAALDNGGKSEAKALWSRLLDLLDPASEDHADLKKMIDGL